MTTKICPVCHSPIPAHAPGGLCPACLLRDAEDPPESGRAVPSIEEVAAAFPNLEVLEKIGQGGMGVVFKARQPALDRIVALKILLPELGRDPAFAERFAREARVLGKLNHPNIVTVFEHGERDGFFYLLMEYVDGVNLRQAMRAGRFTPEQALALVPGICDALQAAHAQGVWHRDIKPENILLDAAGGVKIADFGIARIVGDPHRDFTLTRTGNALGSAAYMAPEQHEKPHDVDHRADIYSLGVVIYEMLTGELPLGRFPVPSRRAEVSALIDEVVLRTLEKERELRQQSATEVKTEVEGAAMKQRHQRVGDAKGSLLRRHSPKAIVLSGALLLALTGVAYFWYSYSKKDLAALAYEESTKQLKLQAVNQLGSWQVALLEMNDPAQNYALGPVIERTLPKPAQGVACMFDFESGLLFNPPDDLGQILGRGDTSFAAPEGSYDQVHFTKSRFDWLLAQGIDAVATMPDCSSIRLFQSMAFPMTGSFDDITADDVEQRVRIGVERSEGARLLLDSFTKREFIQLPTPASTSFAFISAGHYFGDARLGVMEVTGKQTTPEGVKIRYRLMKRMPDTPRSRVEPPTPSAANEAPDLETIVDWKIRVPGRDGKMEESIRLQGKLQAGVNDGYDHSAATIFVGNSNWYPVCTIIGRAKSNGISSKTDGKGLKGSAVIGGQKVEFEIHQVDKVTLNSEERDLNQGRVFLFRPDGSLRQLPIHPDHFISDNELDEFATSLPKEQTRLGRAPGATAEEAMNALLKAATERNGRAFAAGLSRSLTEELRAEGTDPTKSFGDFGSVRLIEATAADSSNANVVVEATDGSKRRLTFRMVMEDGVWKLDDIGR